MSTKKSVRIAFFVSGGGSDMGSVLDAIDAGGLDAVPVYVVSSRDDAYALRRADEYGLQNGVFALKDYGSAEERDLAVLKALDSIGGADLIVLAGYLGIVTPILVRRYQRRIINIHPSLLPKHAGKGCYGIKVHEKVIASGDKKSGATVHFVDEDIDTGEIIMQREVDVLKTDTAESLQKRVLELEHKLLPEAIKKVIEGLR